MKNNVKLFLFILMLLVGCGGKDNENSTANTKLFSTQATSIVQVDEYEELVQKIYVAYFGRPADVSGAAFFANKIRDAGAPKDILSFSNSYNNNHKVREIIDAFGLSKESQDLYPGSNREFITAIYKNLYNREPDSSGLEFWSSRINSGEMSRPAAALLIMAGAQSTDQNTINNKIYAAKNFTKTLIDRGLQSSYSGMDVNELVRANLQNIGRWTSPDEIINEIDKSINAIKNPDSKNNEAPNLRLSATPSATINVGEEYRLQFTASDNDANLSIIHIQWSDGQTESKPITGKFSQQVIARKFSNPGISLSWNVIAYDLSGLPSNSISGNVAIKNNDSGTCQGKDKLYNINESEQISCPDGEQGYQMRICTANGWGPTNNTCKKTQQDSCQGQHKPFQQGESETLNCPDGTKGQQTRTCGQNGQWGELQGVCTSIANKCYGENNREFDQGSYETLPCGGGEEGSKYRICQANGNWSDIFGTCVQKPVVCSGLNGRKYNLNDTESLSCLANQVGEAYRTCIGSENWGPTNYDNCKTRPSIFQLTNATKTGNLTRRFRCRSGSSSCVQAGITLEGIGLSQFKEIVVSWSGGSNGSDVIPFGSGMIESASDSTIVVWPSVFDGSDRVGTCYSWSFSIRKNGQQSNTISLSSGQICRPAGV